MRWMLLIALLLPVGFMAGCHNSPAVAGDADMKTMKFSVDGMT